MPLTIEEELRRTFELATLREEAKSLQTPRQFAAYRGLKQRCDGARTNEKDLYTARYDTRVEAARRRIVDRAAGKTQDLKPSWATDDRFSPAETLRQAQREVRAAHQARIERINRIERESIEHLLERSRRENEVRGTARGSFERAVDRRKGTDRRCGPGPDR